MVQNGSSKKVQETVGKQSTHTKEQRQHEAFRMSEPFFRQIIESLEDYAVFTTDREGVISSWNSGAERLFGYSEEEIIGQNSTMLFVPEDRKHKEPEKELQTAIAYGQGKDEKWHLRKDGTRFWASGLVFPLKDEEGNIQGFTKIARDLTSKKHDEEERKRLMQELEVEQQKLVDIFERAPAFMAILRGKDHVFEMANVAYYQLVGHRDIIGKSIIEALPEVEGQGYIELLDTVLATGEPFIGNEMKVALQRNPGSEIEERYVNFVYEPIKNAESERMGIAAHGYDVTDQVIARQKAERLAIQVEQQARIFDTTLTAIKDFVYTFDTAGRFTYSNKPLLELLGVTLDEIIGKNFHELPYPEELANVLQQQVAHVIATGKGVIDEAAYTSPTGYIGYYEYIFMPVFDNDGKVVLVAGSTRDITSRKQLETQKDDFMGIVSHELKTPVTSIKAFTQVLQRRFAKEGNESATILLSKMNAQINKLNALIGDLLDTTKIDGNKLQFNEDFFSFDTLVEEIIEETQRTTSKHSIKKVGSTSVRLYGDRDRIGQVLINLLTNAIKYSPHADRILVKLATDQKNVTLCVQDFGVGIPREKQAHVFERFYRVSGKAYDTVPGLGLGLFISAEIIKRQGGNIWVESEEGKGSIFCFTLPLQRRNVQQEINTLVQEEIQHE